MIAIYILAGLVAGALAVSAFASKKSDEASRKAAKGNQNAPPPAVNKPKATPPLQPQPVDVALAAAPKALDLARDVFGAFSSEAEAPSLPDDPPGIGD